MNWSDSRRSLTSALLLSSSLGCTGAGVVAIATPDGGARTDLGARVDTGAGTDAGARMDGSTDATAVTDASGDGASPTDTPATDTPATDTSATDAPTGPRWTIFVYGHADHSLSPSLVTDIRKMGEATFGANVNVIVEADFDASRSRGADAGNYPAGTQWLRIRPGMTPEVIMSEPEKNLDAPANLTAGVQFAFSRYPADRYAVVMWNHGGGWSGGFGGDEQDGTNDMPTGMGAAAAATAIQAGLDAVGLEGARRLEFIAFDTCLMSAPEVIRPFRDMAHVFFGNAEIDFGAGWNYGPTLSYIGSHADAPINEIAVQEVRDWNALHSTMGLSDVELRSHVAIDLTHFGDFATAMDTLDSALVSMSPPLVGPARAAYQTLPQYGLSFSGSVPSPKFRDLGQFLGGLSSMAGASANVMTAATAARNALNGMILGSSMGTLRRAAGQSGMHIGLPLPIEWTSTLATAYASLAADWESDSSWGHVLSQLTPGATPAPSIMTGSLANGTNPTATALPAVTITPSGDVAEAITAVLSRVAGTTGADSIFVIREPAARRPLASGTATTLTWDAHLLAMSGQPITVQSYLQGGVDAMGAPVPTVYAIPGVCSFAGPCRILLEAGATPRIVAMLVEDNGRVYAAPLDELLTDFPGATFTPSLERIDTNGVGLAPSLGTPVTLTASPMITRVSAPAGAYVLETTAIDVYGRSTLRLDPVTITTPVTP